jgi:hypothetical protein
MIYVLLKYFNALTTNLLYASALSEWLTLLYFMFMHYIYNHDSL